MKQPKKKIDHKLEAMLRAERENEETFGLVSNLSDRKPQKPRREAKKKDGNSIV